jgi:hypothetical protein
MIRVKLSIKVPASSGRALAAKVSKVYARAVVGIARQRITALVVDRASTTVDKLVPDFAPRYKAALRKPGAVGVTDKEVTIMISDPAVKAVERGAQAFDMKAALLAHGKPAKGGGVYVDVPIRHKPGSVPQAMRTAARRAARVLGGVGEVRLPAKTAGRSFTRQLNRGPISQALGSKPKTQAVQHKRGVHDDLIRRSTRGRGGGISARYATVRRISSRSSASSWWHPGFKARRALDGVLPGAKREIATIIRDAVAATKE